MKVFVNGTTVEAFNHYLIGTDKLTVLTFVRHEGESTGIPDASAVDAFLRAHGDSFSRDVGDLLSCVRGDYLGLSQDDYYDCSARQTLDFAEDGATASDRRLGIGERSDYASWVFPNEPPYLPPYNRFCATALTKSGTQRMTSRGGHFSAQLCVPFADSAITDETNSLLLKPGALGYQVYGLEPGAEMKEISLKELREHQGGWSPFPQVSLDCADACDESGATITIKVAGSDGEPIDRECTAYLECDAGYLGARKVVIKNGTGSTKFLPLGLSAGDAATVKVGFKIFSNLAEKIINVV